MALQKLLAVGIMGIVFCATNNMLIAATDTNQATWVNSLKPKGQPGPELTLSLSGKTDYVILLPAEPTTQDRKAASDLALHLNLISKATFPEILEGRDKLPANAKVISIGQTELLKKTKLAEKKANLGDEGYAIAVKGNNLFLFGGKTRGPIYAVIALLEEDLGVRWYTFDDGKNPGITHIPQMDDLRFRSVPRTFVPKLELRQPFIYDTDNEEWALRNRVNSQYRFGLIRQEWGGSIPCAQKYFVHTFESLVPRAKYFNDHPEYFSMRDGKRDSFQLCASNPEVAKIIINELLAQVKTGREIFSVSPNDGGAYCECPECKALNDAEESGSAAHLRLANTVAAALAEKYPQVKVSHLAYLGADTAPKTLEPNAHVIVEFCTDFDNWRWPFIPYTQTKVTRERLKGWIDKGAYVYVWDYVTNFSHYALPMPNMSVVTENIRFLTENKVKGIYLQGAYQSYGSDRAAMRAWVWSKLLWNPNLDTQELIRDFTYGYYGPAAEPLQQYNELLQQTYEKNIPRFKGDRDCYEGENSLQTPYGIRYNPNVIFLSCPRRYFLNDAWKLFEKAEKLAAESADPNLQRRVRLAKVPLLYTELCNYIRGPRYTNLTPESYSKMIDEFESIANSENILYLEEGPVDVKKRIAIWRELQTIPEDRMGM